MKLKYNIKFRLEQRKDKDSGKIIEKNVPIYLDFTFDGLRFQYYIGYKIDYKQWDFESQRVKKNNFNQDRIRATDINKHLSDIETYVVDIYKENKALHKNPAVDEIREELKKRLYEPEKVDKSFFDYMLEFIDTQSKLKGWTSGTKTKINTKYNHLLAFQNKYRFKIEFNRIDEKFFQKYFTYQREVLKQRNTTMEKNLKVIKWFLNWATQKGYNKNLFYKNFKPEFKGTNRNHKIIFLNWIELMNLYELNINKKYLEHVRDVFCFSCFTGLRYSDVYNLKQSNIKDGTIEITTIKTDDSIIIELNDYSRKILEKYKDMHFKNDKCLPVISNQKYNVYLKELGKLAELNDEETIVYYMGAERIEETYKKHELLSTHVGRKTFITNAFFLGIPSEVIQKWTGHTNHKDLEKYYKIVNPLRKKEMNKFNQN